MMIESDSRERLLAATEDALRRVGMAGVAIKDVIAHSGAPIGSLYYYFPGGKKQLVAEALALHGNRSCRLLERFFAENDPAEAVAALFNTAADVFERTGADKGCAIGAVTLDLAATDEALLEVCKNTFDRWFTIIALRLPCPDERSRQTLAMTIIATVEGAFVLARAARNGAPFRAAGEWLAVLIRSAMSAKARGEGLSSSGAIEE